jgi:hypothetical protein
MDKKLLILFIAVGAGVLTMFLQLMLQGENVGPGHRRFLWPVLVAGVLVFLVLVGVVLKMF